MTEANPITINFKHFTIIVKDEQHEDKFIEELNELCTKFEVIHDGTFFEYDTEM